MTTIIAFEGKGIAVTPCPRTPAFVVTSCPALGLRTLVSRDSDEDFVRAPGLTEAPCPGGLSAGWREHTIGKAPGKFFTHTSRW